MTTKWVEIGIEGDELGELLDGLSALRQQYDLADSARVLRLSTEGGAMRVRLQTVDDDDD